jgi:hypothetical protein
MKLSVWFLGIESERTYVREESKRPHGPYVANAYEDVDEEDEEYGSKTDYRWSSVRILFRKRFGGSTVENAEGSSVVDRLLKGTWDRPIMEHLLGKALAIVAIPFVIATIYFGSKKGNYYESDDYKGNGTAH